MKKIFLMGLALIVSTIMFAQQKQRDPHKIAIRQTEKMKNVVSLNDSQYATIKGINERYAGKMIGLRSAAPEEKGKKRPEMKSLQQQKQKEINEVLTPDQQQKWKTFRAEKKEMRGEKSARRKAHLKSELSLTDEQADKLEQVNKDSRQKQVALKNDNSLSNGDRSAGRHALKIEHHKAVRAILSEDQLKKYQQLKSEKKAKRQERKRDRQ